MSSERAAARLSLRPFERTLNAAVGIFIYYMHDELWAASRGPLDAPALRKIHDDFLQFTVILTVSTLCRLFSEGRGRGGALFSVRREDVLRYVRKPCLPWLCCSRDGRVERLLQAVATETTKKINISLALCPESVLRDLRQNFERAPDTLLLHVRRVRNALMGNSAAGDGAHKNWTGAHHPGMGDAERPRYRFGWEV